MTEGAGSVRVGVVGTGAITQTVHLPILSRLDGVEVVAVSDADEHKAGTVANRFRVPRAVGDDEILADPEIDALLISTPNHLHREQAIAALEADKHVLVERPLAFDGDGVREILAVARERGRIVAASMSHRYRSDVTALRSFIVGGELGDIHAVRSAWLNRRMPLARITWRQRPDEAGGGVLMDLGVQALDLCFWLVGYPEAARVSAVLHRGEHELEEAASVMVVTRDGAAFQVEVSSNLFADEDRRYLRIMGSEGSGSLPPLEIQKQLGGRPMDVTPSPPAARARENPYTSSNRRQLDQFVRAVAGEAEMPLPEEQVGLMDLVQASYRAARAEREVEL